MSSLGHLTSPVRRARTRAPGAWFPGTHQARLSAGDSALPLAAALIACGLVAYLSLSSPTTGDYLIGAPVAADNAAPAVAALSHGNVAGFLSLQPLMGLLSLLVRVPLAALTAAFGGGPTAVYHVGALACMLPTALLAARLAVPLPGATGLPPGATSPSSPPSLAKISAAGMVAAAALLISPPILNGLRFGHPEEALAATLASASLLAAYRGRPVLTGVLLGAAIGTKDWALIAVLPALLALPAERRRAALVGGGVAVALCTPAPLLDPSAFARASHWLGASHLVNALSGWWPLSSHVATAAGTLPARRLPGDLTKALALPLGLALAGALALGGTMRARAGLRARGRSVDAFAVLCLLAAVRCLADPGPVEYYYVALVVPLAVWESAILRRLPLVTLLAVVAVWLTYERTSTFGTGSLSAVTIAWTGVLACYLAFRALRVGVDPRLRNR
jgi:hypothetical protein